MALHDMLASLASRIAGPFLDPRVVPCDTDCWLDTPDEAEDDEPLPDEATPEQEAAVAATYAARRAALVR